MNKADFIKSKSYIYDNEVYINMKEKKYSKQKIYNI